MDELDNLYFGNKMSEVADAIRTFPIIYDITQRELYRKVLDDLKNGTVKEIDIDLYEAYGNGLRKAVDTVLGESEYGDEYFDMQMQMRANVSRFAAYKAYHATQELKDVDPADIDKKGKLILNKYNRWQAAEYNTAVARTRTAKQYHDFTSDPISNELYPNIKWLPSRSASPREVHRVFWNRVWAKNDPFWNSNTPGSLWNCKCDWEETDEPVTNGNPAGNMSAKGLEGNPAVTGEIFYSQKTNGVDRRHPYFSCSNSKKKKIEKYAGDKFLRYESKLCLQTLQKAEPLIIDKRGDNITIVFDSKTTSHLSNDISESANFIWNASIPYIREILKNATLVAHEPNAKLNKKPSAQHYYYYMCKTGNEVFYLNIEENLVAKDNRHFYRLYSITDKLRPTAILY